MTYVVSLFIAVEFELIVFLVDRVVGEVHIHVAKIGANWCGVLLGRKANEALVEEEDAQGVATKNKHVDAQVELEALDEEWLVQVTLYDAMLLSINSFVVTSEEDAFALRHRFWLNDKSFRFLLVKLLAKLAPLCRQAPCGREEVVVLREDASHLH